MSPVLVLLEILQCRREVCKTRPPNPGVNPSLTITAFAEYMMSQIPPKDSAPKYSLESKLTESLQVE